jgi:hypothetical protein
MPDVTEQDTPPRQEIRQHRDHAPHPLVGQEPPAPPFDSPFESQAADNLKRIADGIDTLVKLADAVAGKWLDEFERVRR